MSEAAIKSKPITATDIRLGMLARWKVEEWAIMWEVAPATGFVQKPRYADAVMMSLWPSRGLELHGVEIKVSRSDWKREALDPTKAEAIAAYCDRWWVHVAPGVIQDLSEVPPAWGVREFDGKKWKTLREAAKTEAKACDRAFLASLLRRSDGIQRANAYKDAQDRQAAARAEVEKERAGIEARVKAEVERQAGRARAMAAQIKAFEEASGLTLRSFGEDTTHAARMGALVAAVSQLGIADSYRGLVALSDRLHETADKIKAAMEATGLPSERKDAA